MLRTDELHYELPEERIATHPCAPRDAARLMVVSRTDPHRVEHKFVRDLPEILGRGDVLVVNSTRVVPARFVGERVGSRGGVQGLFLKRHADPETGVSGVERWSVMLKSRRQAPGVRIRCRAHAGRRDPGVILELIERDPDVAGAWVVRVSTECASVPGEEILESIGLPPLPPYILAARKERAEAEDDLHDASDYQTVYAREDGSVAAPTAGLHFTSTLMERLAHAGVSRTEVILHVGTGTFKPVETDFVEQHPIHEEWYLMPVEARRAIEAGRSAGGRVIAVGTTTVRALESATSTGEPVGHWRGTRLLITPGHRFRHVDALMTNFHLPRSSLMALVAAFLGDGCDGGDGLRAAARLRGLYEEAVRRDYRFYSFGDAMLILP